nr:MAG TPA: hypothetical protein [Caudoviricetes sp.]
METRECKFLVHKPVNLKTASLGEKQKPMSRVRH